MILLFFQSEKKGFSVNSKESWKKIKISITSKTDLWQGDISRTQCQECPHNSFTDLSIFSRVVFLQKGTTKNDRLKKNIFSMGKMKHFATWEKRVSRTQYIRYMYRGSLSTTRKNIFRYLFYIHTHIRPPYAFKNDELLMVVVLEMLTILFS